MGRFPVIKEAEEFYYPGNDIGILILHHFSGSTHSTRYIGGQLADQGFTVYGPRLTGHGKCPEDLEKATCNDWIRDVEEGLEKLRERCSKLFVAGLSMGGTLSLYLSEQHANISGVIPINPVIDLPGLRQKYIQSKNKGVRFIGENGPMLQTEIKEVADSRTPVQAIKELLTLMEKVKKNLHKIRVPALIFSSVHDRVVPPENAEFVYYSISSRDKTIFFLKNSGHVATLDHDKDLIADQCIRFINSLTG